MFRTAHLLAATCISAALIAQPAWAQTTPEEEVAAGEAPAEGTGPGPGEPIETGSANAPDQEPAFPEQTRAVQPDEMPETTFEVIAEELPQLWSLALMPNGSMLVAAKDGAFHVISADGEVGEAITEGLPEVDTRNQGGLLDVALAPDFETSNRIFFSYAEPRDGGTGTAVASATLALNEEGGGALEDVSVIFRQEPTYDGTMHYGSRLVFADDGSLFITVGERSDEEVRDQAQDLSSGLGKIFRVTQEGEPHPENPFIEDEEALPEIWSYGHRNLQSATLDEEGRLWTVEHGPRGGDELNLPQAGLNYGWPEVTYGREYSGDEVGPGVTQLEGTEQPVYYWDPVIAPSGMALYEGSEFPEWENALLIGGLVSTGIVIAHVENDRVAFEERVPLDRRVRDVQVGPDGAVYAVTEDRETSMSELLRVTRAD